MSDRIDVLIVDDDADIVSLLVFMLEDAGLRVDVASDGRLGYDLAVRLHPRLILSDLMMPVMAGDALYAAIRSNPETQDVAFVLMTAVPTKAPSGIETVISKPFDLDTLHTVVTQYLG